MKYQRSTEIVNLNQWSTTDATYVGHMCTSDSTGCRLHIRKELDPGFNYERFSKSSLAFVTTAQTLKVKGPIVWREKKKSYRDFDSEMNAF